MLQDNICHNVTHHRISDHHLATLLIKMRWEPSASTRAPAITD